jgi:N utilization substance protein B
MDPDSPISPSARAKIRIRIKGVDYRMIDQSAADIVASVAPTGARISGPFPLPSQVEVYRAAGQDEIRSHRRNIEIINSTAQTVEVMRRINLPTGIEISIVAPDDPIVPDPNAAPAKRNRRHDNRVAAMQFLCSWEVQRHGDMVTTLFDFFTEREQPREYFSFAEELIQGVIRDVALIDEVIGKYAKNWAFARIARVDLAILRVAIFELMRRTDIPPVVSINEAVDIAKEFSTEESKRFVNGILDSYKEELGRDPRKAEGS